MNATQANPCSQSLVDLPPVKDSASDLGESVFTPTETAMDTIALVEVLWTQLQAEIGTTTSKSARAVITRIATEVQRICDKSDRIARSRRSAGKPHLLGPHAVA